MVGASECLCSVFALELPVTRKELEGCARQRRVARVRAVVLGLVSFCLRRAPPPDSVDHPLLPRLLKAFCNSSYPVLDCTTNSTFNGPAGYECRDPTAAPALCMAQVATLPRARISASSALREASVQISAAGSWGCTAPMGRLHRLHHVPGRVFCGLGRRHVLRQCPPGSYCLQGASVPTACLTGMTSAANSSLCVCVCVCVCVCFSLVHVITRFQLDYS
jgi:hypothetical protein